MLLEVLSSADGLDSRDRPLAALREERAGVFLDERHLFCCVRIAGGRGVAPVLR